jgi:hypothetical protein
MRCYRKTICVRSTPSSELALEFAPPIHSENQVRYLNKLGDYVEILQRIPLLLKKLGEVKITIEQVMT